MQGGGPFELDPYTLKTLPGPESLGEFLATDSDPYSIFTKFRDRLLQVFSSKAVKERKPFEKGKPEGKVKACTAHPHVVHGTGLSDRLAIFSSEM